MQILSIHTLVPITLWAIRLRRIGTGGLFLRKYSQTWRGGLDISISRLMRPSQL